jgi:hypothetical protein
MLVLKMETARECDGIRAEACKINIEYRKSGKLNFDVPV